MELSGLVIEGKVFSFRWQNVYEMTLCPVTTTGGVATVSLRQEQRRRYFFALDQREFLNLSSFESRGKNSSKGGSIIGDCEEERKGVRNLVAGKTSSISISYAPERLLYGLSYY